jgi:hypothetical protein
MGQANLGWLMQFHIGPFSDDLKVHFNQYNHEWAFAINYSPSY